MKRLMLFVVFISFLSACGPSPEETTAKTATAAAAAWTPTQAATATATVTATPSPTITPTATLTPTITPTPLGGGLIAVAVGKQIRMLDSQGREIKSYDTGKNVGTFYEHLSNRQYIIYNAKKDENTGEVYSFDVESGESVLLVSNTKGLHYTYSADGQQIAFCVDDGLYLVNIDGSDKKKVAEYCGCDLAWSPTENRIVFEGMPSEAEGHGIYMLDVDSGKITPFTDIHYGSKTEFYGCSMWWSPSGKFIGAYYRYASPNGSTIGFNIIPVDEPQQNFDIVSGTGPGIPFYFEGWLPDDSVISMDLPSGGVGKLIPIGIITVTNVTNKEKGKVIFRPDRGWESFIVLSPDSKRIAVTLGPWDPGENPAFTPYIVNVDGTNKLEVGEPIFWGPDKDIHGPVWSPDSKYIIFRSFKDEKYIVYIADVETGKAQPIYTSTDPINGYTWLP